MVRQPAVDLNISPGDVFLVNNWYGTRGHIISTRPRTITHIEGTNAFYNVHLTDRDDLTHTSISEIQRLLREEIWIRASPAVLLPRGV